MASTSRVTLLLRAAAASCAWIAALGAIAQPVPCRVEGIRSEVLCGSVLRPLDPARPDGTKIVIHYVVVPATARRKLPDAVFLLAGGPGQSAIALAPSVLPLFPRLNNRRDIVFVDQRGTGRSAALECDDPRDLPLAEQAEPHAQERSVLECRDRLARLPWLSDDAQSSLGPQGTPLALGRSGALGDANGLRHFTTWVAMQDLEAVRQQLGGAPVNLVGGSYGTRAALEYMRQFPQGVRRAVLDGVVPPDMALPVASSADAQAAFDALLAACEAEAACAARYPHLRADWVGLLARLPMPITVARPLSGQIERFTLTRDALLQWVRSPLYAPAVAAALPAALHDAARGRFQGLVGLVALVDGRRSSAPAMGMHFSVVCAEDAPRMAASSDRPGADFGDGTAASYGRICASWPRGEVPAAFYKIGQSAAPVLLFSGGLDPATPPRHGALVAAALGPNALHVVVPQAGHGVMSIGCARDLLFRFIDAGTNAEALQLDADCLKHIPRPGAFLPIDAATGHAR